MGGGGRGGCVRCGLSVATMGIVHLPTRPMLMAGGVAALAAAGGGLALLATLTMIGWVTAPHVGLGGGPAGAPPAARGLWVGAHPPAGGGPGAAAGWALPPRAR